jgi:hypothetical protein
MVVMMIMMMTMMMTMNMVMFEDGDDDDDGIDKLIANSVYVSHAYCCYHLLVQIKSDIMNTARTLLYLDKHGRTSPSSQGGCCYAMHWDAMCIDLVVADECIDCIRSQSIRITRHCRFEPYS